MMLCALCLSCRSRPDCPCGSHGLSACPRDPGVPLSSVQRASWTTRARDPCLARSPALVSSPSSGPRLNLGPEPECCSPTVCVVSWIQQRCPSCSWLQGLALRLYSCSACGSCSACVVLWQGASQMSRWGPQVASLTPQIHPCPAHYKTLHAPAMALHDPIQLYGPA